MRANKMSWVQLGLLSTVVSMPIDICKTRLQNMQGNEYRGFADVFVKAVRQEGVFSLWKGFSPYYARLGTHIVIRFVLRVLSLCVCLCSDFSPLFVPNLILFIYYYVSVCVCDSWYAPVGISILLLLL